MALARTTAVATVTPPATGPTSLAAPAGNPSPVGRLPHFPALDGLRGLAVAAVVLFHGGFSWMTGGYLGVSTFFTLSGFLITALLLVERSTTGSVDLRGFWTRRFRRLMPAALATLGVATLFGLTVADAVQQRNLAGDVTASLLDLANWRFIVSGQVYADLFGAPSPVLHFWSLAIEEQFYLLYPLLAWVAFRVLRVSRPVFAAVLVALIAASLALTLFTGFTPDRIYLGTDTRSAELLIGALLATLIYHRPITSALARGTRTRPVVAAVGTLALAVCAVMWVTVPQETSWLYRGGFPAYAALSALVVLAAIVPNGPVRWLLSLGALRYLGRISYGVYLYHWPVFLWLSPARTGWDDAPLLVPRLAVTFALALLSFHLLESPVRRGAPLLGIRPVRFVPIVAGALVLGTLAITLRAPKPAIDFAEAAAELETLSMAPDGAAAAIGGSADGDQTVPAPPPPPPVTVLGTPPRPRVAMFGDSTALMTAMGLYLWSQQSGDVDFVRGDPQLGCGIGRGGEYRSGDDYHVLSQNCDGWQARWADRIATGQPNLVVVQIGPWDVGDRRLAGDDTWRAFGDPVYDEFILREMTTAVDTLSAGGAQVLWLTAPPVGAGTLGDGQALRGVAAQPERTERLNELIAELPSLRPGQVSVVDLAGWLASTGEDVRLRPDGVHFSKETAVEVASRWLEDELIETFERAWTEAESARLAQASAERSRVLVLGDPSAAGIADALATWGASSGLVEVVTIGQPPCGVLRTSDRRAASHAAEPTPDECSNLQYGWMQSAVAAQADVIVVVPSIWDLTDVAFDGGALVAPGDAAYGDQARLQIGELNQALLRAAPEVVWLAPATMSWRGIVGDGATVDADRAAAYTELLRSSVPGAAVVELALVDHELRAIGPAPEHDGFAVDAAQGAALGERLGAALLAAG